jgi:hypothetical protein
VYNKARKGEMPVLPENMIVQQILLASDEVMITTDKRIFERNTYETTIQTEEMPTEIALYNLQEKNGIYYWNDVPFSGKAKKTTKMSEVFGEDETFETWEMKDGKFHGEYTSERDNGGYSGISGNYKDGKKHGEWQYFTLDKELYKTETYKNDKLIKEWTNETSAMPSQNYLGLWRSENDEEIDIISIDNHQITFSFAIIRLFYSEGTAKFENQKIVFVTTDNFSGTMEFKENSIQLTIEKSEPNDFGLEVGKIIHFTNKIR